jgi:hypothetical protein
MNTQISKIVLNHRVVFALALLAGLSLQSAFAQTTRTPSPEGATVRIANIEDRATLPTTFLVKFEVTGMEVAPAGDKTPNTGHHHLLIDVPSLDSASKPLPANANIIHYGAGQTEAEITLKPGKHTLQLIFADANHVPFDPLVMSDQIDIRVDKNLPVGEKPAEEKK